MAESVPDTLNEIGVLRRREIEARIVAPLLDRLAARFGDEVYQVAAATIVDIAREQGAALAAEAGGDSLATFAETLGAWTSGGAMDMTVVEAGEDLFSFDVTRCGYADMYRALGLAGLGAMLSCNRDASLIEGFNPAVSFRRTQTLMEGASHCDFRYRLEATPVELAERR